MCRVFQSYFKLKEEIHEKPNTPFLKLHKTIIKDDEEVEKLNVDGFTIPKKTLKQKLEELDAVKEMITKKEYDKMRSDVEEMKPKGEYNQKIYTEGSFDFDAYGVGEKNCYELKEVKDTTGNTFISWNYDVTNCNWNNWGINWNDWYQVNFRGLENKSELRFKVKTKNNSKFKIKIEDFNYHSSEISSATFTESTQVEWTQVSIPLSDFNLAKNGFVMDQIKQLTFIAEEKGYVFIDDIEIVEIK